MTSIHKASVFPELLTLSFERQHRRQVLIAYILFQAPLIELIVQLFVSVDEVLEIWSSM